MKKILIPLFVFIILQAAVPLVTSAQDYSGYFLPSMSYLTGGNPVSVAIGDVNDDGRNDIVVINSPYGSLVDYEVVVFIQGSDGELEDPVAYECTSPQNSTMVAIGDLNGDGLNDVAVNAAGGVGVYYQNVSGTLDPMVLFILNYSPYKGVRIGDLNNDGRLDLAAHSVGDGSNHIEVFIQDAVGDLASPVAYAISSIYIDVFELADVNDDGLDDVVGLAPFGTDDIFIMHQNVGGTLDASVAYNIGDYPDISSVNGFSIGDVDGDDLNDVIVCYGGNRPSSMIGILYQNVGGTLDTMVSHSSYDIPDAVTVGDANRDGRTDIIVEHTGWHHVGVYYQKSDGTLESEFLYTSYVAQHSKGLTFGDVNSDGMEDIVLISDPWVGLVVNRGWHGSNAIVVQSPSAGEVIHTAGGVGIEWEIVGDITHVSIWYSSDGGSSWALIQNNFLASGGSKSWDVPYTPGEYYVKVEDMEGTAVGIGGPITVVDDGIPRIKVTNPHGGEDWVAGTSHSITWETTGTVGNVKIEYTLDVINPVWVEIEASTENDGFYVWDIPDDIQSEWCQVRVSEAVDGSPLSISAYNFSILEAGSEAISLRDPIGGENLAGGLPYTIVWEYTGVFTSVTLEYSIDGGTNWEYITTSTPNDGSYDWLVPNISSPDCYVRIYDALDGDPRTQSLNPFSIDHSGHAGISVTSPNGGESFLSGSVETITWLSSGDIDNVHIEYSTDNGATWNDIEASILNLGHTVWYVPQVESQQCLVRVSNAANSSVNDVSNQVFSIVVPPPGLTITSPIGREYLQVGTVHNITWSDYQTVGNVKIEYSTDAKSTWKTIVSSTANTGSYPWTVPNKPSSTCYVRISEAADGVPSSTSPRAFTITNGSAVPEISVNRTALYFGAIKSNKAKTPAQKILVGNSGVGVLKWKAAKKEKWLSISATGGTQNGVISVTVDPFGFDPGVYTDAVTITDKEDESRYMDIPVTFTVYPALGDAPPFGGFDSPVDGSTVRSSVPVTGWALDDIAVERVSIWRNKTQAEGEGKVFIGDAVLVEGARPDVEPLYPVTPRNYKAGWGYMMLTYFLPNGGNGTFTLYAYAHDGCDHDVLLGTKTITCDNANAVKPFGAIDTPSQGGEINGETYRNNGWVLTPMPNKIPTNGSTIRVYIDGVKVGNPAYGYAREDVAALFPGYANSSGPHGYFNIDTTVYENGLHTISWVATDNAGNSDGIGSRYFATVENLGYGNAAGKTAGTISSAHKSYVLLSQLDKVPLEMTKPVILVAGYGKDAKTEGVVPGRDGRVRVNMKEDARIELHLSQVSEGYRYTGYLVAGKELRRLPVGSSLDNNRGIFSWQAGAGFLGTYEFLFIRTDADGKMVRYPVTVTIEPKFAKKK